MSTTEESGQMAVFTLGMLLVAFAVAGLAVDGARALVARRALQSSGDAAAVAAAGEIDSDLYYRSGGSRIRLQPHRAESIAREVLALRGLDVATQLHPRADGFDVVLRTEVPTTFLRLVGVGSIPVAVTSSAEPFVQPVPNRR